MSQELQLFIIILTALNLLKYCHKIEFLLLAPKLLFLCLNEFIVPQDVNYVLYHLVKFHTENVIVAKLKNIILKKFSF